jgi:PAS domain S-box-containing protein
MVFESAPIGVINADASGLILRSNRTFQQMLGYAEEELRGLTFLQLTPQDDRQEVLDIIAALALGTTGRARAERRFYCKDGCSIWCQITASAIWDSRGRLMYLVVLIEDLTERKQAEERMRDQAKLLDMADDAIIVNDAGDCVISWNRGAERLYGWHTADTLGRKVTEFLYRDAATYETIKRGLLANGDWSGELRQLTRDAKEVIVNSRATLMRDESNNPKSILVINTDITEKKRLEIQFLRAQRMENIGTLASGIAHDLNNILAPISIAAQILRMTSTDQETTELVERIESSAHRGAEIVRQVLTFARGIQGERVVLQPRHLLREILHIAEQTFPKSIAITYSIAEDLWPVIGDATQLHQVFLNLCVNARDAMPNGGALHLTAANLLLQDTLALLPGAKAGPYILIQVKDTGAGISPDIMDKIFEPFFTTKELGKGTGLGLSTVLGIAKSHGGSVSAYSEPGQGALFKVYLPAAPNVTSAQPPQMRSPSPHGKGELILVVDDETAIRDVMSKILVRHGYTVLLAADGVEGVAMHAQHGAKINLVLADMMMPHMEGLAMIRTLKKLDPNLKIIATSGLANLADQNERGKELKSLGVHEFLSKPCSAEDLLATVNKILA